MLGAIIGDIVGSIYEFESEKSKDFELFTPQSRLTDHRIGLTVHSLTQVMDGEIEEIVRSLEEAYYNRRIETLIAEGA